MLKFKLKSRKTGKKILLVSILCLLGHYSIAQSDYTVYQLAFKQGNKIITIQPDFTTAKATTEVRSKQNDMSQYLIFKRQGDGIIIIASAAAPNHLLVHQNNQVSFEAYDVNSQTLGNKYKWKLSCTVSSSGTVASVGGENKLLALLEHPTMPNHVVTLESDGSMIMATVNRSLSNGPCRLYVIKKLMPGKF